MKLRTRLTLTVIAVMAPTTGVLLWLDATARHDAAAQMLTRIVATDLPGHEDECRATAPRWGHGLFGGPQKGRWVRPPHGRLRAPLGQALPPHGQELTPPEQALAAPDGMPADDNAGHEPLADAPPGELVRDHGPPPAPSDRPPGGPHRPIVAYAYAIDGKPARADAPELDMAIASALKPGDLYVLPWHFFDDDVDVLARTASEDSCAFVVVRGATGAWGAVLPATWLWLLPVLLVSGGVLFFIGSVVERLRKLAFEVRRSADTGYGAAVTAHGNDEVTELAVAFSEASAEIRARVTELERRETALREFIANTTHDVMIPLTVLQGHLAEGETQIVAAREEAHYVAALVHNLGLAARLDAAQPQVAKSRVDLGELLHRVAARHRPVASERDIAIEVGAGLEPVYAMADMTLLEQAVSNLAYNAVRHNREGGHVALIVEASQGPEGRPRFRIRVLDDGPGIPAADIARLMERRARGDAARGRGQGQGQGIGLDIARRAVVVQGFTLTLAPGAESGLEADIEGPAID